MTNTYAAEQAEVVALMDGRKHDSDKGFLEQIVGKKLSRLGVSPGGDYLILLFEDGTGQLLETEGDCCSHSYFYEVLGAKGSFGGTITAIRMLNAPEEEIVDDGSYTQSYGFALDTDLGSVRIVYRNESNGYYGGWCREITPDKISTDVTFDFVLTNDWVA